MNFTTHAPKSIAEREIVTVDEFPEEVAALQSFIRDADPSMVVMEGDRIRFYVANGEATYVIVSRDDVLHTYNLSRLYSKMWSV